MSEKYNPEDVKVLKVFGSRMWHDTVSIIGNRKALKALRNEIDNALNGKPVHEIEVTEDDGEGYNVELLLVDKPFGDEEWLKYPVHYIDELAAENETDKFDYMYEQLEENVIKKDLSKEEI